jgi:transcriptional regulator with XRE-family HTH domain
VVRHAEEGRVTTRGTEASRPAEQEDDSAAVYIRQLGRRLREVRREQGLALEEVEERSREEFKASVMGAYERGERTISVPRLQRLARFYDVPVDRLLPRDGETVLEVQDGDVVTLDLRRLDEMSEHDRELLDRLVRTVRAWRGQPEGAAIQLRKDDLRALAPLLDAVPRQGAAAGP